MPPIMHTVLVDSAVGLYFQALLVFYKDVCLSVNRPKRVLHKFYLV
jgi:hypothetical protein